jgi:two-component system nitrate/nitrite response regulator NarL
VADDHPLFRRAIVRAVVEHPRLEIVGEASNGADALAQVRAREPDVAVLDVRMPGLEGPEVLAELTAEGSRTRVLLLSAYTDGQLVYDALAAGAAGYLSKDADENEITAGIVAAAEGETVVSLDLNAEVLGRIRRQTTRGTPMLSAREREILTLAADGRSGPEIGRELGLKPATVKTYFERIYEKLDVSDRAAAVASAIRLGLLG